MQKTTKPLQNLQGFCKKLQKIQKTVKNILPDPLVCFTIVKDKGVGEKPGDLSTRFFDSRVCRRSCRRHILLHS